MWDNVDNIIKIIKSQIDFISNTTDYMTNNFVLKNMKNFQFKFSSV